MFESFIRALCFSILKKGVPMKDNQILPELSVELRDAPFLTERFVEAYQKSTGITSSTFRCLLIAFTRLTLVIGAAAIVTAAECQSFILPLNLLTHQASPVNAMGSVHVRTAIKVLDHSLFEQYRRGINVTQKAEIVQLRPVKKGTEAMILTRTYAGKELILEDRFYVRHKLAVVCSNLPCTLDDGFP